MPLRPVFSLIFLILLVTLSNVESVGTYSQSGSSQGSSFPTAFINQSEEEERANGERKLYDILQSLEANRNSAEEVRKREQPLPDEMTKQQRRSEKIKLDELELKIRQRIDRVLNMYDSRQPLNVEYSQEINILNKDLAEIRRIFQSIDERQIQERRARDERQIQYLQQQLNKRKELEQRLIILEQAPKDGAAKKEREAEQESLKNIIQILENRLQRLQDWHAKNQSLNEVYNQILQEMNQNYKNFLFITKKIDERRVKERLAEVQVIKKIKVCLDGHKKSELEQRQQEQPPRNEISFIQRKNDEFVYDCLDKAIRLRITSMEQRLVQDNPLDNEYASQRDLLNQDWEKLIAHAKCIEKRRTQKKFNRNKH